MQYNAIRAPTTKCVRLNTPCSKCGHPVASDILINCFLLGKNRPTYRAKNTPKTPKFLIFSVVKIKAGKKHPKAQIVKRFGWEGRNKIFCMREPANKIPKPK